ncbi:gypsy retrotransposon integrase-like protein [Trifolium medium]|uniref:Gypsy retrotransposon integrase-like protein n=1 Tax=Trifolium medium TaxID=97028 RepID=A0A392M1B4_9FABA|nr:gypsy retrotransposon integrase-like protein [Trifolium medium]
MVEHPQTNGQAEAVKRVILRRLKRRLDDVKCNWTDELHHMLWEYRTAPHSTTGETPFRLTYGTKAVVLVEIEETRNYASLTEAAVKKATTTKYNKKVKSRDFLLRDLVLRRANMGGKNARDGKLARNWEGPYSHSWGNNFPGLGA